ncbi:MAG: tRNA 2-thiocytidine(32) synthetase TtcA [Desulfobacteraceae bacterium]|nr:tRNA 2-thiocytidine(32) synthetase TtcA [Desulfobacteraceae bacterium]
MIKDGDRIAVGLSGGKDSWTLMWLLAQRQKRVPVRYDLLPIHVDPGFGGKAAETMKGYCRKMGWDLRIDYTGHGPLAHSEENRENPCFLCSRLRRKRLFEIADELGCSKLALGHNKDDLIETFFLNMLYSGEISTMMPKQRFFKGAFTIIRPLVFADEESIKRFSCDMKWPIEDNPCPSANQSKRAEIKNMLQDLYHKNKKIRGNIFRAMRHVKPEYLL